MSYVTLKLLQRVLEDSSDSKDIIEEESYGTVADLGPVPTGHKKEFHHSMDIDEDDLDDGW